MLFRVFAFALATLSLGFLSDPSQAEEVRLPHGDLSLNGKLDLAQGKTLKNGVILMVHGTLAHYDMDTLKNLRTVLNERGISTLTINLSLGINDRKGMYECSTPHTHKHLDALAEIGTWMNWLKKKGADKVTLFGHSRGGNQAARYAADKGHELLDRLILLAPATWNAKKTASGFENGHKRALGPVFENAQALVKAGKGSEFMPGAGVLYCADTKVTAESFAAYYAPDPNFDTPTVLANGKITIPVLVLAGGEDTVVSDLPAKMKNEADGERIQFNIVADAGHFFLDLFAEDVADYMEEFLHPGS